MRLILLLFDSLNRHVLGRYGGTRSATPNFDRLAERAVRLRQALCRQPALHAGAARHADRPANFLHRSWGPLEPFDNAFPELLRQAGIYSHLVTDHFHYWEDGGATYHNRYDCYEFVRGQEGDPWKAMVQPPLGAAAREVPRRASSTAERAAATACSTSSTASSSREEKDFPSVQCFAHGLRVPRPQPRAPTTGCCRSRPSTRTSPSTRRTRFKEPFRTGWNGADPRLAALRPGRRAAGRDRGAARQLLRARRHCDHYLGQLLDYFDAHDMWKDTALDRHHRPRLPARRARFLGQEPHEPLRGDRRTSRSSSITRTTRQAGARRESLTQTIDLMPTFLDLFGLPVPPEMRGHSLLPLLAGEARSATARFSAISAAPSTSPTGATPITATRAT